MLAALVLASGCSRDGDIAPTATPASLAASAPAVSTVAAVPAGAGDLVVSEGQLGFDGRRIDFPAPSARLTELFGPPSRTVSKGNTIDVWDELGLVSYRKSGTDLVTSITLSLTPGSSAFSPRSVFTGRIVLPGGALDARSEDAERRAAGLLPEGDGMHSWSARLGRLHVLLMDMSDQATASISWLGPAPPPPPPLPDGVLFLARSRDYGCVFEDSIRELNHRGNVSVLAHDTDGHGGGAVGRSLFAMGAVGELALRRGYEYYVLLDDTLPDVPRNGMKVGFTHDAEPDCATEFPLDAGESQCVTLRADTLASAAWPYGASQPETLPAPVSPDSNLWHLVATAHAIVHGQLHADAEALDRASASRGEYVTLEVEVLATLKGDAPPQPLLVKTFVEAGRPGLTSDAIKTLIGKDVLVLAVRIDMPGESTWFLADDSNGSLAPFTAGLVADVRAEVGRQRAQIASIPPPATAEELALDARVAQIIERMLSAATATAAYAELEELGEPAVPFIIRRMDDRRRLPVPSIELANRSDLRESTRTYSPELVVDVLAAILDQLTGVHFALGFNGPHGEGERQSEVNAWKVFLMRSLSR